MSRNGASPLRDDDVSGCIDACVDCGLACADCADACDADLARREVLRDSAQLALDAAAACAAAANVLSRRIPPGSASARALLEACVAACRACARECEQHGTSGDPCGACAEKCRACEVRCLALLAR